MRKTAWFSNLFYVSAAYDGILGFSFLFFPLVVFQWQSVSPPNHVGYIQFPAALLIIFASLFIAIGNDPVRNRNLIPYGFMLKIAYSGVVFWHWFSAGIPDMWKPFALIDIFFAALFLWCYLELKEGKDDPRDA